MFIYNVTCKVDHSIAADWLQWMKTEHIPELIATGCFQKAVILQLLDVDEAEGPTYAVQYYAENRAQYNRYIENFAAPMRKKGMEKWGNKTIAFRSVMQVVD